jgi:midasin (ATPase involved in ribosome maturation)
MALAAWMRVDGLKPLGFRLFGPPGVGKNMIVYQLARMLNKDLYMVNGNAELSPEDIACSARIASTGEIEYVASPLFAAMLRGGIFFFDEIAKAPPAALNPLASVLDDRRTLSSGLASIRLEAHEEFRFCAALNEDEETTGRLPQFLEERLNPAIYVGIPSAETLKQILASVFPQADETWIDIYLAAFWKEDISPREAVTHLQFARALAARGNSPDTERKIREYLRKAHACRKGAESAGTTANRSETVKGTRKLSKKVKEIFDGYAPFVVTPPNGGQRRTH